MGWSWSQGSGQESGTISVTIGRDERDEMVPSISAAKLAGLLDTKLGYFLGESDAHGLFKDPELLTYFKKLRSIGAKSASTFYFALDFNA